MITMLHVVYMIHRKLIKHIMYLYGVYNTYDTSKIKVWDLTLAVVGTETLGVWT